jgi:uncharacterized protein YecT (DUF1311 family)
MQASAAIDCKNATSTNTNTNTINECALIEQKQVEAKLNAVYQRVMKHLGQPDSETDKYAETKAALLAAQRAWVKFREADCHAMYLHYQGGTIRGVIYITCMQSHAESRIKELERFE